MYDEIAILANKGENIEMINYLQTLYKNISKKVKQELYQTASSHNKSIYIKKFL